ncbi:hypothetical protein [Methylococcus mesophilus]|uniref:hypothetical protein n=1 Tax=Methylococcus mesophilus TaxID=2993564 RepID=UPI00224B536D|nr:hypothetical protein [Methylococcus mesophilus]UZR28712.1 hypothetical protein OOT43_18680 [Methylococcus mesophilus]
MIDIRLEKLFSECDKHLARINRAAAKMAHFMPLNPATFRELTEDDIEHIDQFLFRFAKLQDAIGERLIVLLLEFLQEPNPKGKPFIDILNRLEQLGIMDDKNAWLELRKYRNNITHQYEDEPRLAAEALNAIYTGKSTLEQIYQRLKASYFQARGKASS